MRLVWLSIAALLVQFVYGQQPPQKQFCWIPDFNNLFPEQRCVLSFSPDDCAKPYAVKFATPGSDMNWTPVQNAAATCCSHPLFRVGLRVSKPQIWTQSWGPSRDTQGTAQCGCAVGATCSDICNTWDPNNNDFCPCFAPNWNTLTCEQITSKSCRLQGIDVFNLSDKDLARCCTRIGSSGLWKKDSDITGLCKGPTVKCGRIPRSSRWKCWKV